MRNTYSLTVLAVASIACGVGCTPSETATSEYAPLDVGESVPSITAEGWINGPGPSPGDLENKVVLIDVWAYW